MMSCRVTINLNLRPQVPMIWNGLMTTSAPSLFNFRAINNSLKDRGLLTSRYGMSVGNSFS